MNKLIDLISKITEQLIPVSVKFDDVTGLTFEVDGFSKSGTASVYAEFDKVICRTRYGKRYEVETLSDVSSIAFGWYIDYKDSYAFKDPDPYWLPIWLSEGKIKEETETIKKYTVK